MECDKCNEIDISLNEYFEIAPGIFEAQFTCRQCNNIFMLTISKKELDIFI